jgi:hypothetical protein
MPLLLEGYPSKVLGNFSSKIQRGKKKDKVLMWRAFRGKRKEEEKGGV